jgi:hypothetical protein
MQAHSQPNELQQALSNPALIKLLNTIPKDPDVIQIDSLGTFVKSVQHWFIRKLFYNEDNVHTDICYHLKILNPKDAQNFATRLIQYAKGKNANITEASVKEQYGKGHNGQQYRTTNEVVTNLPVVGDEHTHTQIIITKIRNQMHK